MKAPQFKHLPNSLEEIEKRLRVRSYGYKDRNAQVRRDLLWLAAETKRHYSFIGAVAELNPNAPYPAIAELVAEARELAPATQGTQENE